MRIRLGNSPDSWGVWFPHDPDQVPWGRFLDEVASAGYRYLELGPYGYLPTDPAQLRDELESRDLHPVASFIETCLEDPERYAEIEKKVLELAGWIHAFGGKFLNVIDDAYRDLRTGEQIAPATLDPSAWSHLLETLNRLGRVVHDRHGITITVHPHVDTHIETTEQVEALLSGTDPDAVSLCLDTGHFAYRGGDPIALLRAHSDRIPYFHIKNVDPAVLETVNAEDLPLVRAVQLEVFCEPDAGLLGFAELRNVLAELDYDGYLTVEQDMFRPAFDEPLPIAERTRTYLESIGLGDS